MGLVFLLGDLIEDASRPDDPEIQSARASTILVEAYLPRALTSEERTDLLNRFAWDELAGHTLSLKQASDIALRLAQPDTHDLWDDCLSFEELGEYEREAYAA